MSQSMDIGTTVPITGLLTSTVNINAMGSRSHYPQVLLSVYDLPI
jgi:hypothetical protein